MTDHQSYSIFRFNQQGANKALKNKNNMGTPALTVDEMIDGFPNPILPSVLNEPVFEDIMMTHKLLSANCISIPSGADGGCYGHLGVIQTAQQYATISNVPFGPAADPGPITIVAIGTGAVEAASLVRLHDEPKRIFVTQNNVEEA